jgi:hypothetical protein
MSFLTLENMSAWARAGAVAGAVAAVAALVAMYFLKLKRRRTEIPSTYLWKKSVEDLRANSPFQRLRRNLLLLLQLLVLVAALLALGRPALLPSSRAGVSYIVLIDTSASMAATDVSPNRLAAAAARVRAIIDDMSSADQMMILAFGAHPNVEATATSDRGALYAALGAVRCGDTATDIIEPLDLAESLSRTLPNPRIVLVSDGAFGGSVQLPPVTAPLEFVSVGRNAGNVGITAMDVRSSVDDPSAGEIFARVANFSQAPVTADVTLLLDGKLADAASIKVDPGTSQACVFDVRLDIEKTAEVLIESADDLAADNRAWAILEPPKTVRAVIVGPANAFLKTALTSGTGFEVAEAAAQDFSAAGEGEPPVYIFDGASPPLPLRGGYLVFDAVPAGAGFKDSGEVTNPVILDVDTSHPVTSFLDLGDIFLEKARKISFPPETKVLVTGDDGPLVALSYVGAARVLTVAFDPMNSRWPLRISYPMFVANAVNFLASGGRLASSRRFQAGEALVLECAPGLEEISVTDPDGRKSTLPCEAQGTVAYGKTSRAGIYTIGSGGSTAAYAANLTNAAESDIRPVRQFGLGSATVTAAVAAAPKNSEIWRELLVFAFVVLLVEWYVYNRRVYL